VRNLKILIVEDSSSASVVILRMICEKMGIPLEITKGKNISEIFEEITLQRPQEIPILEIPIFFEELLEKKRFFPSDVPKIIFIAGQPKTVRIRSPCKTGIFYFYPQVYLYFLCIMNT